MKTIYIECTMGAAGDMLLAALIELMPQPEAFVDRLNSIGVPKVTYKLKKQSKCGVIGTRIEVDVMGAAEDENMHEHHHHHHHHHSRPRDIEHIINQLAVSEAVKKNALAVYKLIAEAESEAHGMPVEEIHFHEVGTMDAVADIAGVCLAMEELAPDRVIASPVNVGSGTVKCAHGILPVPAPATAYILRGIPTYSGEIKSELCTPTGAALLRHFASLFMSMPVMKVTAIGYGMGHKEFEVANCVRIMLGETEDGTEQVAELRCNLDDMTGEGIGYVIEKLFAAGALDVFTIPIGMKKNRPGVLLTCMCRESDREKMLRLLFLHTTTLGVREYVCRRYTLTREETKLNTNYGTVSAKRSYGWGAERIKPEYEELRAIAEENDIPINKIKY
ncbi:MAG: nickel pincer cofactor biosynthesis protein LarC [Clostridia bacterium]|nr:nickel pincer cofactor biosynthesis protein LarC [Clostridia bacterium]